MYILLCCSIRASDADANDVFLLHLAIMFCPMIVTLSRCRTGLNTSITPPLTLTHSHPATSAAGWMQIVAETWEIISCSQARSYVCVFCGELSSSEFSVPVDLCVLMFSPAPSALRLRRCLHVCFTVLHRGWAKQHGRRSYKNLHGKIVNFLPFSAFCFPFHFDSLLQFFL